MTIAIAESPRAMQPMRAISFIMTTMLTIASAFAAFGNAVGAPAESAKPDANSSDVVVMTLNLRYDNPGDGRDAWPFRRDDVAAYIIRQQADLLGFQEALESQVKFLKEKLTDYEMFGVGRDDGKSKGEFSPLFYRRARFEIVPRMRNDDGQSAKTADKAPPADEGRGTIWLSEKPDEPGSKGWDAALPRIATWLRLKDKANGRVFLVANVHFDHKGEKARVESGKLLRRRLGELAGGAPVVLLGDLNATPKSPPYEAIVDSKPLEGAPNAGILTDVRTLVDKPLGPDTTWNSFKKPAAGQQIDHVFVDRQWETRAFAIVDEKRANGRFYSDHFPIVARLCIKP